MTGTVRFKSSFEDGIRSYGQAFEGDLTVHLYSQYRTVGGDEWFFFTAGLGEMSFIKQLVRCLKRLKPQRLGRVVWSLGSNYSALNCYRGDYNIWWEWGCQTLQEVDQVLNQMNVPPDLVLSPHPKVVEHLEEKGYHVLWAPAAVDPETFYPLGQQREGLGYYGLDTKPAGVKEQVLGPVLTRGDFQWTSSRLEEMKPLDEVNEWLNSKLVVFGMIFPDREELGSCTLRVMECLASGTPLIISENWLIDKSLGFHYPYQTGSAEETEALIEEIMGDKEEVLNRMAEYSEYVRRMHTFTVRLETVFKELECL